MCVVIGHLYTVCHQIILLYIECVVSVEVVLVSFVDQYLLFFFSFFVYLLLFIKSEVLLISCFWLPIWFVLKKNKIFIQYGLFSLFMSFFPTGKEI